MTSFPHSILTGCKIIHSQGRDTWRHNQVLAATIEIKRTATNALTSKITKAFQRKTFVPEWEQGQKGPPPLTSPGPETGTLLTVPSHIVTTTLRWILWSNTLGFVYFVELTVPWEDPVEEANERERQNNVAEKQQLALWWLAAGVSVQHPPPGCSKIWGSTDKPCTRPQQKHHTLQNAAANGSES